MLVSYSLTFLSAIYLYQSANSAPADSPNLEIQHGDEAKPHVAPYAILIFQKPINGPPNMGQKCGASLLNNDFILTAAHCVENTASLKIFAGYHNYKTPESNSQLISDYAYIKIHPGWQSSNRQRDDIAVIKLNKPIDYSPYYIQPVKLPTYSDVGNTYVGEEATAYGWGRDDSNSTSDVLRQVTVEVIGNHECRTYFANVPDSKLCTSGEGGKGTCKGDSGGPLVLSNGKLIGVVQSSKCTVYPNAPRVFTRVTDYLTWIETQTNVHIDP